MKTKGFLTLLLIAAVFAIVPGSAVAQSTVEVDLKVAQDDITFTPPGPVVVRAHTVQIDALIHNLGICYVVLADNNDEITFDFNLSAEVTGVKITARVRSSNGDLLTIPVWIDGSAPNSLLKNSTSWTEETTNFPSLVVGSGSHTLHVKLLSGGDAGTDLHVDYVEVRRVSDNGLLFSAEAEDYDSGGPSVDAIRPENVTVQFYDGDPDAGGIKIGADQIIGNTTRETEAGTGVLILTASGSDTATEFWLAEFPIGLHSIYVRVQADGLETIVTNNKDLEVIEVLVPTLSEWGMIVLMIAVFGAGIFVIVKKRQKHVHTA